MADRTNAPNRPPTVTVRGKAVRVRTIGFVVLAGLAIWFIAANTASTEIHLWIPTVTLPLWLVLAVTLVVGAALGWYLSRRRLPRE
ncbi:DUF1049 domain-containing protein [Streptomyces tateyamensis]|uniref:DUF1049 domain-containing protein n=1 Tax=Streptomyces tateyamensis TaxID=565073 RepID=A0A2V4NEU7_9ACTN|nr:LapA family protein [Streptomyces tateyamensis]PYC77715.1 DUF1049 domain-containing protein [Streptomyces tateyamensis]